MDPGEMQKISILKRKVSIFSSGKSLNFVTCGELSSSEKVYFCLNSFFVLYGCEDVWCLTYLGEKNCWKKTKQIGKMPVFADRY